MGGDRRLVGGARRYLRAARRRGRGCRRLRRRRPPLRAGPAAGGAARSPPRGGLRAGRRRRQAGGGVAVGRGEAWRRSDASGRRWRPYPGRGGGGAVRPSVRPSVGRGGRRGWGRCGSDDGQGREPEGGSAACLCLWARSVSGDRPALLEGSGGLGGSLPGAGGHTGP